MMKTGPIVLFILAVLFFFSALRNVSNIPQGMGNVSYLVGSFMPSIVCVIAGLVLMNTGKKKE